MAARVTLSHGGTIQIDRSDAHDNIAIVRVDTRDEAVMVLASTSEIRTLAARLGEIADEMDRASD